MIVIEIMSYNDEQQLQKEAVFLYPDNEEKRDQYIVYNFWKVAKARLPTEEERAARTREVESDRLLSWTTVQYTVSRLYMRLHATLAIFHHFRGIFLHIA